MTDDFDADGLNAMSNVKKVYRPDWIDAENKLFINKLNFICENFDKNNLDVKKLKNVVFKTHKVEIEELYQKQKDLHDDYMISKDKLLKIEDNMPQMIREMINYCLDQKLENRMQTMVTKTELREKISYKMDYAMFNDWCKREIEQRDLDRQEFGVNERFNKLEKQIRTLITENDLKRELSDKTDSTDFRSLNEQVTRFKTDSH